jgi:membrane fusion protein (multidrug efflux system)
MAGCRRQPPGDAAKNAGETAAIPVEVAKLARGPIEAGLRTFATLEAEQDVKVFARTANRVVELRVEEGDRVTLNQILLRLDDTNQQVAVDKAAITLEKARQEFERLEALFAQKLISAQVHADARFDLRSRELALAEAQRELEFTIIRAPIDGTLSRRHVKLGDLVSPNQHLFDLVDFQSIVARVYVPEKNLPDLALDQVARVSAPALGDREFAGEVRRIAPVVDARTGTVKVTIGFDDIGPLRPGMYVDVDLVLARKTDALLLPKRALVLDGDQSFAFRLGEDRRVQRVLVEAKVTDRLNVEPASGFHDGDEVVVAGQTGLKDGARVRLPGDPDPEAEARTKADQAPLRAAR